MASHLFTQLTSEWGIWLLADGKIDGAGYGNKFTDGPHLGCDYIGWIVIIPDDGCGLQAIDWEGCQT